MAFGDTRILTPLELTRRFESPAGQKEYRAWSQLLVATPAVLSYLGLEPSAVDPGADFLVDRGVVTDRLFIPSISGRKLLPVANVQKLDLGRRLFGFASAPPNLITLAGLRRHGWNQVPAGWLVESSKPMTSDQTAEARDVASQAGLTIEVQHEADSLARVMAIAIGAGGLLALAVLALTVGLIRSESAGDLRTLTATGATSGIRRRLTASTAGALALLGAILGVGGAYVVLAAIYHDDLEYLSDVPVLHLALALLGVPVAAAAAGWLVAGREPSAIARPVLE
jgi:putative ABC transport system permease protein